MKKAFLDTDMLIACYSKNDTSHQKALKIIKENSNKNWTVYLSINILMETLTLISQRISKKTALEVLKELRSGTYNIINPKEEDIILAESIFKQIKSKNVSYSDCLSFALMTIYDIKDVFSFDIHFKKQGFKRIGVDF
jgi:hypothetical protein